jgi:hypothetical protein
MTFFQWYLILIHALAFLGLSLAGAIARHIWLTWDRHKPEPEQILAAETIVTWAGREPVVFK